MRDKILLSAMFGMLVGMVLAQSGPLSAQDSGAATCQESKTIFRDVSRFSRKHNGAENMTEKHNEYTKGGWRFVDMETYIENGDLEGFFLTYSRDIACT